MKLPNKNYALISVYFAWMHAISISAHAWQWDQNGVTPRDPTFLDQVINIKPDVERVYLALDVNCLLSVFEHSLRSQHNVNVVVSGKPALPQWLTSKAAAEHRTDGIGMFQLASGDQDAEADVVMACCGDAPILEILSNISMAAQLKQMNQDRLNENKQYINKHGEDVPEICNWEWEPDQCVQTAMNRANDREDIRGANDSKSIHH